MSAATEAAIGPKVGVGTGDDGTWEAAGNIRGPSGSASIPDPLVLNTIQVNTTLMIGNNMRLVPTPTGGRIETKNISGVWEIQAEWP